MRSVFGVLSREGGPELAQLGNSGLDMAAGRSAYGLAPLGTEHSASLDGFNATGPMPEAITRPRAPAQWA